MIYNFIFVIWHYFWPPEKEKQIIGRQPKKQKKFVIWCEKSNDPPTKRSLKHMMLFLLR